MAYNYCRKISLDTHWEADLLPQCSIVENSINMSPLRAI